MRSSRRRPKRQRSREHLTWVDLAVHPDERPGSQVDDFSDPRAGAVLRAFHDRYAELLTKRSAARVQKEDDELTTMLKSLGYTGDEGAEGEEFALPPPGEAILR